MSFFFIEGGRGGGILVISLDISGKKYFIYCETKCLTFIGVISTSQIHGKSVTVLGTNETVAIRTADFFFPH